MAPPDTKPKPKPKRKRTLAARWHDFCERTAFRLLDERDVPPHLRGTSLLLAAVLHRIGRFFYPRWLSNAIRRRQAEQEVDVESRGFARFTEMLEGMATGVGYQLQAAGSWLYKLFVPEKLIKSTERAVAEKSADTYWGVRKFCKKIYDRVVPAWLRKRLGFFTRFLNAVYVFFTTWTKSRDWKKLAWALPALMLSLPLFGAVAASIVYTNQQKQEHYRLALQEAIDNREEKAETVLLQKLAQLGFRQVDLAEFGAALALVEEEEDGKWDEAVARIRALAPLDDPDREGLAEAHLWLAGKLLGDEIEVAEDVKWDRIRQHAELARELSNNRQRYIRDNARLLLAKLRGRSGDVDGAYREMEELAGAIPSVSFELVQRAMLVRDIAMARKHARKVIDMCEALVPAGTSAVEGEDPPLTEYQFLVWSAAAELVDGKPAAEAALQRARKHHPNDEAIRLRLGTLIELPLRRADLASADTLALLKKVLAVYPESRAAADLLGNAVLNDQPIARDVVMQLIQANALPIDLCMELGDKRWSLQDAAGALWYYEQAAKIDGEFGSCLEQHRVATGLRRPDEGSAEGTRCRQSSGCFNQRSTVFRNARTNLRQFGTVAGGYPGPADCGQRSLAR